MLKFGTAQSRSIRCSKLSTKPVVRRSAMPTAPSSSGRSGSRHRVVGLSAALFGRCGLPGHGGIEPDRQRTAALERCVTGGPVPGLVGGGCGSAHAIQLPHWIHKMNPSRDLCNRAGHLTEQVRVPCGDRKRSVQFCLVDRDAETVCSQSRTDRTTRRRIKRVGFGRARAGLLRRRVALLHKSREGFIL